MEQGEFVCSEEEYKNRIRKCAFSGTASPSFIRISFETVTGWMFPMLSFKNRLHFEKQKSK
jgi:hypothetical protein